MQFATVGRLAACSDVVRYLADRFEDLRDGPFRGPAVQDYGFVLRQAREQRERLLGWRLMACGLKLVQAVK